MDLIISKVVTAIGRITRRHVNLDTSAVDEKDYRRDYVPPAQPLDRSNLVVSTVRAADPVITERREYHAPVLDCDFPVYAIPSTTPGNTHVYFDKILTWEQYEKVLKVLAEVGLIEPGYADASIAHRESAVRLPGVKKIPRQTCPCGAEVGVSFVEHGVYYYESHRAPDLRRCQYSLTPIRP